MVGLAETTVPVEELKPVVGDQVYVTAPFAVKLTGLPPGLQNDGAEELIDIVGGPLVTTGRLELHMLPQASVTVQTYVWVPAVVVIVAVFPPNGLPSSVQE